MGSGGRRPLVVLILQGFLALVVLAVLGISIAVLVTSLNIQTNQNQLIQNTGKTVAPANNALNIQKPLQISSGQSSYSAYQQVVTLLQTGMDRTADPCNDFYQYTCGKYSGNMPMSFDVSDDGNAAKMAEQMNNQTYVSGAPQSVKTLVQWYNSCIDTMVNFNASVADGSVITNAISAMKFGAVDNGKQVPSTINLPFPMWDGGNQTTPLDRVQLGYIIGAPTGLFGSSNLISAYTDTNWRDPHGPQGYKFYIDQPTTLLPNTYYQGSLWATYGPALHQSIIDTMNTYARTQNVVLPQESLNASAQAIVDLDFQLATVYSTDDTTRRQYLRSYNLMTIEQMNNSYPMLSFHTFIPVATKAASFAVQSLLLATPNNTMVVMEPDRLTSLYNLLMNSTALSPNTLLNYIYYSGAVNSQSDYLPDYSSAREKIREAWRTTKSRRGIAQSWRHKIRAGDMSKDDATQTCAANSVFLLQYANARVFIDKIYPTNDSRIAVRNNVAQIASSILVGFRSMIDQLDWMTASTKKGAYSKIENLVKNIAYPDWITDNAALDAYHQTLNFTVNATFFSMMDQITAFNMYQQWNTLILGEANRIDFNGPPGTTNAWYQPELNSITFPAAILRQPFYDPSWPAAVNFGAMGVIAGHELTHGFDDEGVQWDSTGILSGWMDSQSAQNFSNMAQCVVDEYSTFCPLSEAQYGSGHCVNGAQTQGENIADNGGIHAAFRAYKNYQNLYGPDPQLPDPTMQFFTADQLFFLAFAQVWCQVPSTNSQMERQILVDVHSPSQYRVLGTIQNFPAFKDAFNCPSGSVYAPTKHCDVWVSNITSSYGLPTSKTDVNVAPNPPVYPRNVDQFNAYGNAINYYNYSMDLTADPCQDFWQYSCGNYHQQVSFHFADGNNLVTMVNQLTDPAYQPTVASSQALTKEQTFFNSCVNTNNDATVTNNTLVQSNYLWNKVSALNDTLGGGVFPLLTGTKATKPTPLQLARALGYLSFTQGIDTLVTPMVDTYWTNNAQGYQFFIDQNSCEMSKSYYQEAWNTTKPGYLASSYATLQQFCIEQQAASKFTCTSLNTTTLSDLLEFERLLATKYSTPDDDRRQYNRSWNPTKKTDLQTNYGFIDWNSYLAMVPTAGGKVVQNANYLPAVMETGMLGSLSKDISSEAISADNVINYLYFRLILDSAAFLPSYNTSSSYASTESVSIGLKRRRSPRPPRWEMSDATDTQKNCMGQTNALMQFANGRVFIDNKYPTDDAKAAIRVAAGGMIKNVINSFQGMLEQLDWMDADSQRKALDKTNGIIKNIAFPDWITNNTALDAYYSDLSFTNMNYFQMLDALTEFNIGLQYKQLTAPQTDRFDFLGQPATVNAWYQPELNSITFPAGILVPPYFDPNWPASINYGGLGVVAGHELTHGFDDEGVQWGPTGDLFTWMDQNSTIGFNDMANCVINEYSQFCPLQNTTYVPKCVNGAQTQGENIADNGGIHAAYRAYRIHTNLNGPDPQLNDRIFGQFTHDQLFFINFGQVWCEQRRTDALLYKQLMVDPHSPSQYRVFGTIQNFPAFQTAFNCPANSPYAPAQHCKVWVPNFEA